MEYDSNIYYIQLLRYNQSLKKNGKNLQEQDKEKYLKLLKDSVKLSDQVHWQQTRDYLTDWRQT